MSSKEIFSNFANTDLIELKYNISPWDTTESSLILINHDRHGGFKKFTFRGVSNLRIDEDFSGYLGGTVIVDISDRQWAHAAIEVQNFESGSGLYFLAMTVDISDLPNL
ncbi:hypothetical protein NB545_06090 [Vibrio campbellii]|uniref:hypothetical protein n=1 Tax=Vibrio campbellii TaxID=680 RepID=UPI00215C922D|nr:hypothetical protein [Vibrio campbellii]MCR9907037.1 hypothetical protein [Vibrio campbellii]